MKPYSMDLRLRVLQDCDAGLPTQAVADKYKVSDSFVRKLKRRRLTGSAAPATARLPPPGRTTATPAPTPRTSAARPGRPCRWPRRRPRW